MLHCITRFRRMHGTRIDNNFSSYVNFFTFTLEAVYMIKLMRIFIPVLFIVNSDMKMMATAIF